MTSHSNAEQEEPTTGFPTTDSESDVEEDAQNDVDEEEMKKWLSTTYEGGSRKPMKEPLTASWGLPISDADVEKLKVGFKSQSMDDKWDMLIEEPDENGNVSLHIIRSWLQEECYILHIVPKPGNDDAGVQRSKASPGKGTRQGCNAMQSRPRRKL